MHPDKARRVVLGLGSNLGDRLTMVRSAAQRLRSLPGVSGSVQSRWYETTPVGGPVQRDFINGALLLQTDRSAMSLLEASLKIEAVLGRVRTERNGPRSLDIDLLWIEGEIVDRPELVVPHPRLAQRAFALLPLMDIAPDARDPATGRLFASWLELLSLDGVREVDERQMLLMEATMIGSGHPAVPLD